MKSQGITIIIQFILWEDLYQIKLEIRHVGVEMFHLEPEICTASGTT